MKLKRDWNEKIKEYKNSGLGVTAWCKTQNIPDSTFSYHLHKEGRQRALVLSNSKKNHLT